MSLLSVSGSVIGSPGREVSAIRRSNIIHWMGFGSASGRSHIGKDEDVENNTPECDNRLGRNKLGTGGNVISFRTARYRQHGGISLYKEGVVSDNQSNGSSGTS